MNKVAGPYDYVFWVNNGDGTRSTEFSRTLPARHCEDWGVTTLYAIPDTHCVVPREATEMMIDKMSAEYLADIYSAESLSKTNKEIVRSPMRSAYKAMLNAAEVGGES